jgi:outer membrane receptor protein involved in Fe transport
VYNNVGTYLQGQYVPVEKLSFTLGVRYDHNSRFGSTVNPRIGAVFTPAEKTTIKALYGTAYWAPSPLVSFESYGSFYTLDAGKTYQAAYWHLPNPTLKPMTSQTAELSLNQKVGKNFSATLTGYFTQIDNMIANGPDNGNTNLYNNQFLGWEVGYIEVPFNHGSQKIKGGNLMVNSTFNVGKGKLNAYSSVSYVGGTSLEFVSWDQAKEVELALIAPWQFRLGLDGTYNNFHYSVRYQRVGEQTMGGFADPSNPNKRQRIPGYNLLNASVGYTWKNKATLFINVQNALDQRYRNPLLTDITDANAPIFNGSLQDPIRVFAGVRLAVF